MFLCVVTWVGLMIINYSLEAGVRGCDNVGVTWNDQEEAWTIYAAGDNITLVEDELNEVDRLVALIREQRKAECES